MKDKNKIIAFIAVIAILFIGFFLYGTPDKNTDKEITDNITQFAGISALETPEISYDFGNISMKNGNVSKIFKVINPTDKDIKVPSLTTSGMCTTAYIIKEDGSRSRPFGMPGHGRAVPQANAIVKAGGALDIEVVYDPNAHGPAGIGRIERSVFLEDESGEALEFRFRATVTP